MPSQVSRVHPTRHQHALYHSSVRPKTGLAPNAPRAGLLSGQRSARGPRRRGLAEASRIEHVGLDAALAHTERPHEGCSDRSLGLAHDGEGVGAGHEDDAAGLQGLEEAMNLAVGIRRSRCASSLGG